MGMSKDNRLSEMFMLLVLNLYVVNGIGFPFQSGLKFLNNRILAGKPLNMSEVDFKWINNP